MSIHVQVEAPPSFQFQPTLLSHGWLELPPFDHDPAFTELRRVERLESGRVIDLVFSPGSDRTIEVLADGLQETGDATAVDEIERLTRRIFHLDADLEPFYDLLDGMPRYAWVREHGAGRLLRAPSVWEDLAKTLLTTNTSWSMTRQMVRRLNEIGQRGGAGYAFPTAGQVASVPFDAFADQVRAGYRNAYLYELAEALATKQLDVEAWAETERSSDELYREVRKLKGFGPYAAGAALKLLGRFDYLAIDSTVRSMFSRTFGADSTAKDADIQQHYASFGSWKGLVVWMDLMKDWFLIRQTAREE